MNKATRGGLVDYSHRLKISTTGGEPNYYRDSYNVDIQTIPAKIIDLSGVKDITMEPVAVIEILAFERDIVYGSAKNWANYGTGYPEFTQR